MLICICCAIFLTRLRVSFCIKFKKKNNKKKKDSRAIQQIVFIGKIKATVANTRVVIFYALEKWKETILEFSKGTTKVL